MATDTYYPQTYITEAGIIEKHYVWASKVDEAVFTAADGSLLTYQNIYEEKINDAPGILTMTKNRVSVDSATKKRVQADRKKRAADHFKKEVYPTIDKKDRQHFAKKHNLKT